MLIYLFLYLVFPNDSLCDVITVEVFFLFFFYYLNSVYTVLPLSFRFWGLHQDGGTSR